MSDVKISNNDLIKISKFIFRVLKKEPELIGLHPSKDGWVEINELIRLSVEYQIKNNYIQLTDQILDEIVNRPSDGVQRYEISEDGWLIRTIDSEFKAVVDSNIPNSLFYVCSESDANFALANSLFKKNRKIELDEDATLAWICNELSLKGKKVLLEINSKQMSLDGESLNKIGETLWSAKTIASKYITVKYTKKD